MLIFADLAWILDFMHVCMYVIVGEMWKFADLAWILDFMYVCERWLVSVEICELSLDSGFYACMWAVMDIKIFRWSLNCRTNLNKIELAWIRIFDLALLM